MPQDTQQKSQSGDSRAAQNRHLGCDPLCFHLFPKEEKFQVDVKLKTKPKISGTDTNKCLD